MWWKQKELFAIEPKRAFDGATYNPELDYKRLNSQLTRVYILMKDGRWRNLDEISKHVGGSPASISARLRDLRKPKYGSRVVERLHVKNGLFLYRVRP